MDILKSLQNEKGRETKTKHTSLMSNYVPAVVKKVSTEWWGKLPGIQWFFTYRLHNKTWQTENKNVGIVACMLDKYVGIVQRNKT